MKWVFFTSGCKLNIYREKERSDNECFSLTLKLLYPFNDDVSECTALRVNN